MKPRGTPPGGPPSPLPPPPDIADDAVPPASGKLRPLPPAVIGWLSTAYPWLRAHALRLGLSAGDADDVVQQTIIAAASSWYSYRDTGAGRRAWLWGVMQNCARMHQRHARTELAFSAAAREPLVSDTPDIPVHAASVVQYLRGATTPERWQAFWAVYVEGDSAAEYARRANLSPNTVANLLRLAREDLRAALGRDDAAAKGPLVRRPPRSKP